MTEQEFIQIVRAHHGRIFLVGGFVRDFFLNRPSHDKDYVVCHLAKKIFDELFQKIILDFSSGVYRVTLDQKICQVALARTEKKIAGGYHGFEFFYDDSITIEEDLQRRDTTVNALALELPEKNLIDLFGGMNDLKQKKLRAINQKFSQDPIRSLRVARQAAELDFSITDETISLMNASKLEFLQQPTERIFFEFKKALETKKNKPSLFFIALQKAGLLEIIFPEIFNLIGKTQPKIFHPEGDAFIHSMIVLDRTSSSTNNVTTRFAALCHDLGKGTTPEEMLPHHYFHETRGLDVLESWNERMTLPKDFKKAAQFVIVNHMRAPVIKKFGKIVDLLLSIEKLNAISPKEFAFILEADCAPDFSLPKHFQSEYIDEVLSVLHQVSGKDFCQNFAGEKLADVLRRKRIELLKLWEKQKSE